PPCRSLEGLYPARSLRSPPSTWPASGHGEAEERPRAQPKKRGQATPQSQKVACPPLASQLSIWAPLRAACQGSRSEPALSLVEEEVHANRMQLGPPEEREIHVRYTLFLGQRELPPCGTADQSNLLVLSAAPSRITELRR